LDQVATLTLIVVAIRWTDHRLSPIGINMKQLGFAPSHPVQKPAGLSLQVPDFEGPPAEPKGSRKALPSGVKVILNLVPPGVAAVNGWPLKNMVLMSLGRIASAARATVGTKPKYKIAVRNSIMITGEELLKNLAQPVAMRNIVRCGDVRYGSFATESLGFQLCRMSAVHPIATE
jgi:hypothetical protein